ncbi:MAG: FHA domain-containing protein, partial [Halioglobus sp.]|nr:FHA domain-containing protein [Halioglobus sp.]
MADQGVSARLLASDGTSYELSGEQTLGRSKDADITISDPKISRSHARFKLAGTELTVEDLGSANGTRVNQRKIDVPTALANGDTIS